jgi:hypothetical protein
LPKEEQVFYVRLDEPIHLRKEVLLCRKQALQILHKNERIKILRREKTLVMDELRKKLRDVYYYNNKLRSLLPAAHVRSQKRTEPEFPKQEKEKLRKEIPPNPSGIIERELTHIEKIEQELRDIETKLDEL